MRREGLFLSPKIELGSRGPAVTSALVQAAPGPGCITMKCIQPIGSIYTITVSKVSVVFCFFFIFPSCYLKGLKSSTEDFMEASSKAVFFSVCSYFEQSKLLCPFPRPCSRHALEVLFAVGLRHSLKLSLLYYWIADVQNLQGPDPRPGWERGEARLCPGSRPGARCESRGADCSPFERTLHNSSPSHGVGIRVAEDENGPGGGGGYIGVFCLAVGLAA